MANNPKHGDGIIESRPNQLGGKKLVASFQFQRFLDELASLVDVQTENTQGDTDQQLAILSANIDQLRAVVGNHIDDFSDLEQLVHDS